MPELEASLVIKQDGVVVPGFPINTDKLTVAGAASFAEDKADGDGPAPLPGNQFPLNRVLVIRPLTQEISVQIAGGTRTITIKPGGLFVIFNGEFNEADVDNESGFATRVLGLIAGDPLAELIFFDTVSGGDIFFEGVPNGLIHWNRS